MSFIGIKIYNYTQIIEMQQDPLFCKPSTPTESYSFQIIDFSDGKK